MDKLNQYFHVADTTQNPPRRQPGHDKLAHVRPIMDTRQTMNTPLIKKCPWMRQWLKYWAVRLQTVRPLEAHKIRDKSLDEGRSKQWVRQRVPSLHREKGLGECVVKDLTRSIWGKYHHIYCDNYFTLIDLFHELLGNKTYACGKIRTNRKGLPPAVSKCKLKKQGQMVQRQNDAMVATAWHDKRTVTLLSANSNPLEMTEVPRKQKNGTIINVACPKVLKFVHAEYEWGEQS